MKLAIDIVLLPPEEIMDYVIEINKTEVSKGELNKTDFLPHISLAMGVIEESNLEKLKIIVEGLFTHPIKLQLDKFYYVEDYAKERSYGILIKGEKLQKMHEELMDKTKDLISYDATRENIYNQEAEPTAVNDFKEKYALENYQPHITIRCKEVNGELERKEFTINKIAICHLGVSTTCRKILIEKNLI
jgi:hypothetical protein